MVSDIKASCGLRETPVTSPTSLTYFSSHCRASECLTQLGGKSCWAGYSYQDRLRCVTVLLKSTGCSPKTSLSPGLWVSLSPSPTLSVCLSPFPSLACRIDPLNAFRISHLTSCTCCFSSSVSPLGVQRENLADRFSFFLSTGRAFFLSFQFAEREELSYTNAKSMKSLNHAIYTQRACAELGLQWTFLDRCPWEKTKSQIAEIQPILITFLCLILKQRIIFEQLWYERCIGQ